MTMIWRPQRDKVSDPYRAGGSKWFPPIYLRLGFATFEPVPDPLVEEKPLDPVVVSNPLGYQRLAFAGNAEPIFCLEARHLDHRAHPWLSSLVGHQRPD